MLFRRFERGCLAKGGPGRLRRALYRVLGWIGLLSMGGAVATAAGAAEHCVVLQYHHVSERTPPSTSVTPQQFEAHLAFLDKGAFAVQPLQEVVERLRAGGQVAERCVAISFDDAYASVYHEAFPRLAARGWPFTVFINSEAVDEAVPGYMSWEQLREMAAAGVRFENHSHTHDHLVRRQEGEGEEVWRERVRHDLETARLRIAEELGQDSRLLAYPYGEYDPAAQALGRELGLTAFGQQSGPLGHGSDFLALPRFPMAADFAAMESFALKVATVPLPQRREPRGDPVLPLEVWRPVMTLEPDLARVNPGALNCYVSGQGKAAITVDPEDVSRWRVQAQEPLAVGRNRYNCTAPVGDGRWYWFSHNWFRRDADGRWYRE